MGWASAASTYSQPHAQPPSGTTAAQTSAGGNLLDLSDLLGEGGGGGAPQTVSAIPDPHPSGKVTLDLRLNPQVRGAPV